MGPKTVLWLEDNDTSRNAVGAELRDQGFEVLSAANVEEAWALLEQADYGVDVCLLDMELKDPRSPNVTTAPAVTGASFGIEVKERMPRHPPECAIYSAFSPSKYFQEVLQLGARVFLEKGPSRTADIVRSVRVLALRRALYLSDDLIQKINHLARQSRSELEALVGFSREVLARELAATLGAPFVLLVGRGKYTRCLGLPSDVPADPAAFAAIQKSAVAAMREQPCVNVRDIPAGEGLAGETTQKCLAGLREYWFVRLGQTDDDDISLGIRWNPAAPEDAKLLAATVASLIPRAVLQPLMALTREFAIVHTQQRAILEAAASFCLYVGQEQVRVFDRALSSRSILYDDLGPDLRRLVSFSEQLRTAGELLTWAGGSRPAAPLREPRRWSMRRLVDDAWEDLCGYLEIADAEGIHVEGDCWVEGQAGDLQVAVARVLQWLTARNRASEHGRVSVTCGPLTDAGGASIVFEDGSRRLPRELRERLFLPFGLPILEDLSDPMRSSEGIGLYLSKVLVETANGGVLEDHSDELEGEHGHRFVMSFPATNGAVAAPMA